MLSADETNRRIVAARTLRGLSQTALDRRGLEYGLGKQELSRVERGEIPFTQKHRNALVDLLGVDERWFTADDVDELIRGDRPLSVAAEVRLLAERQQTFEAAVNRMLQAVEAVLPRVSRGSRRAAGS